MNTDKIFAETIANEYSVKNTSKVIQLKKLDMKVKLPPLIMAYILGIAFTLVLGVGMCLSMGVIGTSSTVNTVIGSIVGVVGIIGVSVNYVIYKKFLSTRKQKYANDIITLANEISDDI